MAKFTAADAEEWDFFGCSVAISGDTVIVGAYADDDQVNFSGSATVFSRNLGGADGWGQSHKLTAGDAAAGDYFGKSVAISGNTVVIAAPEDDDAGSGSGCAYAFTLRGGVWTQVASPVANDPADGDQFGYRVAIDGDLLVAGAYMDDDAGFASGSAYVFARNETAADGWGLLKKLVASDAAEIDQFGLAVALDGDVVVIAAQGNDDAGASSGSAYVFKRNQGGPDNWGEVKKLVASDAAADDRFGSSVAVSGDTVFVGAPYDDDGADRSGSVYVFVRNQGAADNWGELRKLNALDAAVNVSFGSQLAAGGDVAVVGMSGDASAGASTGAAYVFSRNQGGADNWGQVTKLAASGPAAYDYFGASVAFAGQLLVAGAPGRDGAFANAGSAGSRRLATPAIWSSGPR